MTSQTRPLFAKPQMTRMTRWLAVGLALLFIGVAVSLVVFVQSRFEKLDQQPIQGVVFAGSQLRIELMIFRMALSHAQLTGEAEDLRKAMEAYEILLSRLAMFESRSGLRLPSNDPGLVAKYREVSAEIRAWEPAMAAIGAGDASRVAALTDSINDNAIEFAQLSTLINDYVYLWFVRNAESLDGFFIVLAMVTLAAITALGWLLRYLLLSVREAETAYDELGAAHQALSAAKQAAEASDRVKSQFLANVSHELRTPLNAIIGFSEMLLDSALSAATEGRKQEYLGYVLNSGRHLLSLINDILDFSKIQQGHWELRPAPLELRAELNEALQMMSAVAAGRRVRLTERVELEIARIETDARAFRQILLNVLSNAVKFSPTDGRVVVEMRATQREVVVEIDDQGPGIDDDFAKQIGAPFLQARSSAYSGEAGTGLGLAITIELLRRIGGRFAIANRPEGGARVTLTFPAAAPAMARPPLAA